MVSANGHHAGKVIQVIGSTFDAEFDEGYLPEIYSIGHRNPLGLTLHPVTGEIWESEFGPRGGDEVNRIQAGKNYG